MEKFDVYDSDKQNTGIVHSHGYELDEGQYRLVIHVLVFSQDGRLLIQKRRDDDKKWPGKWDVSVSGCAIAGETGRDAAMREAREELDLELDLTNARPALTVSFASGFDEVFLVEKDVDIAALVLQESEVTDVRWATLNEILTMIKNGAFTPFIEDYIKLLFKMRSTHDVFA